MFTVFVSASTGQTGLYDVPHSTRAVFSLRTEARKYLDHLIDNRKPAAGYAPIERYWWICTNGITRRYTIEVASPGQCDH